MGASARPSFDPRSYWPPFLTCVAVALLALTVPPEARAGSMPARAASSAPPPSESDSVIYPPERIPLAFDHRRHARLGTGCVYCHERATTSRDTADRLLPPPERCDACHGTYHDPRAPSVVTPGLGPAAECSYCHVDGRESPRALLPNGTTLSRVVIPPANLRFDHAAHWSRGIACTRCHQGVAEHTLATRSTLPRMDLCVSCHRRGGSAKPGCDVCHQTIDGSRLRTSFPTGKLFPGSWMPQAEHGGDFVYRHKLVAGANSAACAACHSESECVDCHDGRVRPRQVHPNDWIGLHAMAARQDEPSCGGCHRAQSFCITCHQRAGVAQSGPAGNAADRGRFHPPKAVWTDPPRTARHHAWEAERNITACVSCHTERDCATCHATAARGGQGGLSPHPPGFDSVCASAFSKNPRPCLFCHDAGDPSLSRCR